jgi:hypothetical protein
MELTCNMCRAPVTAGGDDLSRGITRCLHCGTVFHLAGRKGAELGVKDVQPRRLARAKLPKKFQVEEEPGLVRISWRWFTPSLLFLTFFCIVWDGFLLLWYTAAFAFPDIPLMFKVFPLLHVAVGVGLTYRVIAGFVNSTRVEVTRRSLSIQHGPMRWKRNRTIQGSDLKQLFCKQKVHRTNDTETYTYELLAFTRDGQTLTLLDSLEEPRQALYLEEQLERRLGIDNEPVEGELDRDSLVA